MAQDHQSFPPRSRQRRGRRGRHDVGLLAERLERRAVLSVTPSLSAATLAIVIADGDTATLTYSPTTGYAVNGAPIAGTALPGSVRSIVVSDDGSPDTVFAVAGAIPAAAGLESLTASVGGSAGGTINLEAAVVCAGTAPIRLTVSEELASPGTIRLAAGLAAGMQTVSFNGPVMLGADVTVSTRGGAVTFAGTLDGGFTLASDTNRAGGSGGSVTFASAVGSLMPLAGLKILSGGVVQAGPGATIAVDAAAADPQSDVGRAGIVVRAGCGPVSLGHGGSVDNFAAHGILLAGTPAGATTVVSGFRLTGNGDSAIRVVGQGAGSTLTISDNTITMPVSAAQATTGILVTGTFPAAGGGNTLAIRANTIDFDPADPLAASPTYGIVVEPAAGVVNATVGGAAGEAAGNTITGATVGFGTLGIVVAQAARGTAVVGNDLAGCGYGIVLIDSGAGTAPAVVRGNTLDGTQPETATVSPRIGVVMVGAGGVTVGGADTGNTVRAYPYGLVAYGDSTGSAVLGNIFTGPGYDATHGVGVSLIDAAGLSVGAAAAGNTISGAAVGVYAMGDATGAIVQANTIQDVSLGVVIAAARKLAVGAPGAGNVLGQIVPGSNPLAVGIYAGGDCEGSSIRANVVTNTADTSMTPSLGIFLDGARDLTVGGGVSAGANPGNTVTGFFAGGYATGALDGTSLRGNVIASAAGGDPARTVIGLQLADARGLAVGDVNDRTTTQGNTFTRASGFGVHASGDCTGTMLAANLLTASPYGVYSRGATGLTLSGNHVAENDVGVAFDGPVGTTTLYSNRIFANRSAGIRLASLAANQGVAAPVLEAVAPLAEAAAAGATLEGTITGLTGRTYRIQYFATPASISASDGPPQGRTPLVLASGLDFEDVTIEEGDAVRLAPFFAGADGTATVAPGDVLTATATLLAEGPGSETVATSEFSAGVTLAPATTKPLALTFDTAALGPGLDPGNVWVSIRAEGGAGGLAGLLVTYSGADAANRLVPFATAGDAISTPLSLAEITDPASGKPTLRVTEGVGLSVFVSYGTPLAVGPAAPDPLAPGDVNATTRYQHFELTRHHPAAASDRVNLAHVAYFTAPMSLRSFAGDGTPLEQKWVGVSADTAGAVYAELAAIKTAGGTVGQSSAVVRDDSGVVRVVGPSSFAAGSPYPSLLPYVRSLAGTTTHIWNFADVATADGWAAWRIDLGAGAPAGDEQAGEVAAQGGSLTMKVDDGGGGTTAGTIRVFGTIAVTQTLGGDARQLYEATAEEPWLLISAADAALFDAAVYSQARSGGFPAVSYPSGEWERLATDLADQGATAPDEPRSIAQRLLVGDVTAAILLGFAGAAPIDTAYAPFRGTVRPLAAVGGPAITYDGDGDDPPPIAVKDMRSREWWSFDATAGGGPPAPKTLQPTNAFYDPFAQVIRAASGNQTATIPYADRLGGGPTMDAAWHVKSATSAAAPREYTVGWIEVGLAAPISLPGPTGPGVADAAADADVAS